LQSSPPRGTLIAPELVPQVSLEWGRQDPGRMRSIGQTCKEIAMSHRVSAFAAKLPVIVGTALIALGGSAAFATQEPVQSAPDGPVRKELKEFLEKSAKTTPQETQRIYAEGIEEVRRSGVLDTALKVGDKAPDFELPDAVGKSVKLSDLTAKGPVVVTWYRGGWCPYCNIALRGFTKALPEIRSAGANLVAISPETPDSALNTVQKNQLDFAVLSDRDNKVARTFGIAYKVPGAVIESLKKSGRDLARLNGSDSGELPLGVTYGIDSDRTIRYAFLDSNYRRRAEPADVIAAIKTLKK
jgi:peroxiredoxin